MDPDNSCFFTDGKGHEYTYISPGHRISSNYDHPDAYRLGWFDLRDLVHFAQWGYALGILFCCRTGSDRDGSAWNCVS